MKIAKYLVLSLFVITHLSCSKDDDNTQSFDIVGKWSITEGKIIPTTIPLDMGGMIIPVEISGSIIDIDETNNIRFKEDNSFTSDTGTLSLKMNMVIMGAPQTEIIEMNDVFGEGTWEVNGRELKIHNENGTTIKFTIDNLSADFLELSANVKDMSMEGDSNPMLESMDIVVQMKFKRI